MAGLLVMLMALSGVMSYVGIAYLKNCPVSPLIPVYLIVAGPIGASHRNPVKCPSLPMEGWTELEGMVELVILYFKHRRLRSEDDGAVDDVDSVEGLRDGHPSPQYTTTSTRVPLPTSPFPGPRPSKSARWRSGWCWSSCSSGSRSGTTGSSPSTSRPTARATAPREGPRLVCPWVGLGG